MGSTEDSLEAMFARMNTQAIPLILAFHQKSQDITNKLEEYANELMRSLESGDFRNNSLLTRSPLPATTSKAHKRHVLSTSDEEQEVSSTSKVQSETGSGKPKRNASKMASMKIGTQTKMKLNTKMRRPSSGNNENQSVLVTSSKHISVNVKKEKGLEDAPAEDTTSVQTVLNDSTNTKNAMPPPKSKPLPKRGRPKKIKREQDSSDDTENEGLQSRSTRSNSVVKQEVVEKIAEAVRDIRSTRSNMRSTRSKVQKIRKDSDVIIQEVAVPCVVVSDTESEDTTATESASEKITEETSKEKGDRKAGSVYEDASSETKKDDLSALKEKALTMNCTVVLHKMNETVSLKNDVNKTMVMSPREGVPHIADVTRIITPVSDVTRIITPVSDIANSTVVLSPKEGLPHIADKSAPLWQKLETQTVSSEPLLTDDESIEITEKKAKVKKAIKSKPMFSPYANSPVKKRVAAFEKLGNEAVDVPARTTRTKTRNMAKAEKEREEQQTGIPRPKFTTPLTSNKLPPMIPHTDGRYRSATTAVMLANCSKQPSGMSMSTISTESIKCATTTKPTKVEMQERREEEQRRRMEKEDDVKRKKEAMIQARIDEQRRKREEKQIRAQKTREAKEREKEDKLRQLLQEKEEKQQVELQRQRELAAKKALEQEEKRKHEEQVRLNKLREQEEEAIRMLAKKKMEEEERRIAEEERRLAEKERKVAEMRQLKLAESLAKKNCELMKPPPLPTDDNEDSDSDESSEQVKKRNPGPEWGQRKRLCTVLLWQRHLPVPCVEALFQMQPTTPDLQAIFETLDARHLHRNSSALWRTPPRYSQLPKF